MRLIQHFNWLDENKQRIIRLLKKLIRTPSLSGEEEALAQIVSEELKRLDFEVELDSLGSVIAKRGTGKGKCILFDAHMDHIEPGELDNWKYAPYGAEIKDGVIYGRGTVDMKGALAAMVYGLAAPNFDGDLYLACVVHEETNEGIATKKIIEDKGLKPVACVLGEPTNLALSIGQRGRAVYRIITRGVTSHASMPELGENALYKMTKIIEAIKESNENLPSDPFLGSGTVSVIDIKCLPGGGPIVPDFCEIIVDRRSIPVENPDGIEKELEMLAVGGSVELVEDEYTCYTGYTGKARQYFPGWITDRNHWVVKQGLKVLEGVLGKKPSVIGWRFSTDGIATAGELNIPTIGFGPGDPALAHQPNEHIAISDVITAAKIYCSLAYILSS